MIFCEVLKGEKDFDLHSIVHRTPSPGKVLKSEKSDKQGKDGLFISGKSRLKSKGFLLWPHFAVDHCLKYETKQRNKEEKEMSSSGHS